MRVRATADLYQDVSGRMIERVRSMAPRLACLRMAITLGLTLVFSVVLWMSAHRASGEDVAPEGSVASPAGGVVGNESRSRLALAEAKADLAGHPPNRDAARAAFGRATSADDDPSAVAEAYFRLGVLEEEDGAFARALEDQRACMAKGAPGNFGRSARLRIGWISARSEGDFAPLERLQRVRRDPALPNDPAAIESLATDAESFPPGRVRAEARMFVAEAWLDRMKRRVDAIGELRKVADDRSSDSMDAAVAHRRLAEALLAEGRLDDAASEVESHPLDPMLGAQVHRLLRRRTLQRVAVAELALCCGLAAVVLAWKRARRGRDAWLSVRRALRGFAPVALAGGLALLCCVSVIAVAFVLLDATNAKYLETFGL